MNSDDDKNPSGAAPKNNKPEGAEPASQWTGGKEGKKAVWQVPFGVGLIVILLVAAFIVLRETDILSRISIYDTPPTVMD